MSSQILHEPIWPVVKAAQSPWAVGTQCFKGCSGVVLESSEIRTPLCKGLREQSKRELHPKLSADGQSTDPVSAERRADATGGRENGNLLFYLCKLLIKTHCVFKLPVKFSFGCYHGRKSRKSICFQHLVCFYLLFELLKRPVAENVLKQL